MLLGRSTPVASTRAGVQRFPVRDAEYIILSVGLRYQTATISPVGLWASADVAVDGSPAEPADGDAVGLAEALAR